MKLQEREAGINKGVVRCSQILESPYAGQDLSACLTACLYDIRACGYLALMAKRQAASCTYRLGLAGFMSDN